MASTADFKNGLMSWNSTMTFITIVEFQHVKPGKGPAFVRTKLKSLTTGKVLDNTFNSAKRSRLPGSKNEPHQFIYADDMGYHFMDT